MAQGRFTDCEAVNDQLEAYKKQSDTVRVFLDEQGYEVSSDYMPLKDLYRDYKSFCLENGYRPVNNRNFQKRLNASGIQTTRQKFGFVAYLSQTDTPY